MKTTEAADPLATQETTQTLFSVPAAELQGVCGSVCSLFRINLNHKQIELRCFILSI